MSETYHLLPKFRKREMEIQQARTLARIARETGGVGMSERPVRSKLPGDPWALRGIPVVGPRGVGGAINGTKPHVSAGDTKPEVIVLRTAGVLCYIRSA